MNWYAWINIILGLWLILSPFLLGFESDQAIWNSAIVGFLVIFVTLASKNQAETRKSTFHYK